MVATAAQHVVAGYRCAQHVATTSAHTLYPWGTSYPDQDERRHVNKLRYQTFLLTRVLQGNGYASTQELLDTITAACEIPESEWSARKAAFNTLADKAPLRTGRTSDIAITHSDLPGFLEREWFEFNSFSAMTKNISRAAELDAAVQRYWLTDEQTDYTKRPGDEAAPDTSDEAEGAPRM